MTGGRRACAPAAFPLASPLTVCYAAWWARPEVAGGKRMNRWRWALLVALAVPFGAAAFPPLPKPRENKAAALALDKALQGRWEVSKIERGGAAGKAMNLAYSMTLTIKGSEMARTLKIKDRELKAAGAKITLDAGKRPAWFDISPVGGKVGAKGAIGSLLGVVKVSGDTMTWTYAAAGGPRPTTIDGKLGERQYRYTLRRVKP